MSARSHAGRSHETLPAIRSSSPSAIHKSANKIQSESLTLPPIQSLTREFPPRVEHVHSEPVPRHSPPDQGAPYQRKRSAPGLTADSTSPPNSFKRRKVDLLENNGSNQNLPSQATLSGHSDLQSRSQYMLDLPTAPSATQGHSSRPVHLKGRTLVHEHRRHLSTGSNIPFPSQDPILKQEQISPPAVVVQSPATPSTGGAYNSSNSTWQNESASFSRRISSASTNRPTSRKQPPSHLTFQPHRSNGSLDSIVEPSIRSAPPVPVPGQLAGELAMKNNSMWLNSRAANQSRIVHPGRTSEISTAGKVSVKDVWPSIPTPTSLRLGARTSVNPAPPSNPAIATATSPSGRLPLTPAVPSPIPTLGGGAALTDKAKFIQRMSDMYDKANAHKNCITAEEVDRKLKDALLVRDQEIFSLKREVNDLRKLVNERKAPYLDQDGDAVMAANISRPPRTLSNTTQSKTASGTSSPPPVDPKDATMKAGSPTSKSPEDVAHPPKSAVVQAANGKRIPSASPEASNSTTTE